ncbi:MAG: hypothetical protein ACOX6E_09130, partial [Syntrophomonadaceae bacterium]
MVKVLPVADSVQLAGATSVMVTVPLTVTPLLKEALGVFTIRLPMIRLPALPVRTEVPAPLCWKVKSPVKVYAPKLMVSERVMVGLALMFPVRVMVVMLLLLNALVSSVALLTLAV